MITLEDIDRLQELYDATGGEIGPVEKKGYFTFYPDPINDLMFYIADSPWFNPNYDPNYIDYSNQVIEELSLVELTALLTWCSRNEMLTSGHWIRVFEQELIPGIIFRVRDLVNKRDYQD